MQWLLYGRKYYVRSVTSFPFIGSLNFVYLWIQSGQCQHHEGTVLTFKFQCCSLLLINPICVTETGIWDEFFAYLAES
jgi:hypothetical protein